MYVMYRILLKCIIIYYFQKNDPFRSIKHEMANFIDRYHMKKVFFRQNHEIFVQNIGVDSGSYC